MSWSWGRKQEAPSDRGRPLWLELHWGAISHHEGRGTVLLQYSQWRRWSPEKLNEWLSEWGNNEWMDGWMEGEWVELCEMRLEREAGLIRGWGWGIPTLYKAFGFYSELSGKSVKGFKQMLRWSDLHCLEEYCVILENRSVWVNLVNPSLFQRLRLHTLGII